MSRANESPPESILANRSIDYMGGVCGVRWRTLLHQQGHGRSCHPLDSTLGLQ